MHNANSILSDLRRTSFPETVWGRFSVDRDGTVRWYRRVGERLREIGFVATIVDELDASARDLDIAGRS